MEWQWVEEDVEVLKNDLTEMAESTDKHLPDVSNKPENNLTADENSKSVVEKIGLYLKSALLTLEYHNNVSRSASERTYSSLRNNSERCQDIRSQTDADEQAFLSRQFKRFESELKDGFVKAKEQEFNSYLKSNGITCYFTLSIDNNLDANLDELDYFLDKSFALDFKPVVRSKESSLLTAADPLNGNWIKGSVSFRIAGENIRLVIEFSQGGNYLMVGFAPAGTPMAKNNFPFDRPPHDKLWKNMTDKRWFQWHGVNNVQQTFILRHHGILARIAAIGDNRISGVSIALTTISAAVTTDSKFGLGNSRLLSTVMLNEGKRIRGKDSKSLLCSLESYGYVLVISNYLNVSLNEPRVYLENGQSPVHLPELVTALGREVFIAEADYCGDKNGGLITFRIDTTDLRLAIAFQLFNNGNAFAIGFLPAFGGADEETLMEFLTNRNNWSTCMDHKYAGAKDGEQVIETRNIQACASMTQDMKALMKITISTI